MPVAMPRVHFLILILAAFLAVALFLAASALHFRLGFPLDDSWIHQTYARNLAQRGEWSFIPGKPSGGSTSPLWNILLSLGFHLRLAPYFWTYFLGALFLFGVGVLIENTTRRLLPFYRPLLPWMGLLLIFEWRMVWMAASGMETLLHALLLSAIAMLVMDERPRFLTLGLLAGLAVWVRPDGLLLFPFLVLIASLWPLPLKARLRQVLNLTLGFVPLFGFYLFFNLSLEGHPWPNTFYAKQTEYLFWQQKPILERLGLYLLQWIHGPIVLLLPAVLFFFFHLFRAPSGTFLAWFRLPNWILLMWWGTFFAIYLLRLPPYQHGRYVMPLLPLFLFWGTVGMMLAARSGKIAWRRVGMSAWRISLGALVVIYLFFGARAYAQEVAFIEREMVDTARWVRANLPPQAVIAAHDIGALGYFDTHPLVDLAGLISPEVIPILNDEQALAAYLDAQGVDYLIVLQGIYPTLEAGREVVYQGFSADIPGAEVTPMNVYRWR